MSKPKWSKPKMTGLICIALFLVAAAAPQQQPTDLRLRADALEDLYDMNLTPDQLHAVAKLAVGASQKAENARLGQPLHKALNELCQAFAKSDDEHIDALQEKVDQLEEKANIDDPVIESTDVARSRAEAVIKLLTPGELANLIAMHSDEIEAPAETLIAAFDDQHGDSDDDFKDEQTDTVHEVVELTKGFEGDKRLADQVGELLAKAHKLNDADFKTQREALNAEARRICPVLDSFVVMKHWTLREFAELLSNPELPTAIDMRLANRPADAEKK